MSGDRETAKRLMILVWLTEIKFSLQHMCTKKLAILPGYGYIFWPNAHLSQRPSHILAVVSMN